MALACMLGLTALQPPAAGGTLRCAAYTYRGDDASVPVSAFTPAEVIALRVRLQGLEAGGYTLEARWFNRFSELQEQAQLPFALDSPGDFAADFALRLRPAGLMRRMTSSVQEDGYHLNFMGKWQVRIFLDDREVARREFEIH
jgi:hypothetical protein